MSDKTSSSSSTGISFGGMLAILFIGLKLTGYIDWSWWWVLCPLWIPLAIFFVIVFGGLAVAGICGAIAMWLDSK